MSRPWYRLNIDISNAVRADFDFDKLYAESEFAGKPIGLWAYFQDQLTEVVNDTWLSNMSEQGLVPTGIMIFYRQPYYVTPEAHIDIRKNNAVAVYAINWVVSPNDDSEMIWFDMPASRGIEDITPASTLYKSWPMGELTEISRCCLGEIPTLVNIGIPHNVIVRSQPRWVISVRFQFEEHILDWEAAVNSLQNFIITPL